MAEEMVRTVEAGPYIKDRFYQYGMSVIEERALPDIRDGLKPVNRAIVYEILKSGVTSDSKPTKVARISGNVIGNWHPHGDKAVEDALAGMAQWWSNSLPTVEIKGNGGSIFGDGAAAGRYIEARLTKAGDAYGYNLKEGIVPYVPNFDETGKMPEILPARLPYVLINGIKEGIAVGVAANMPPHNPREVLTMVLAYLKDPSIKTAQLLEYMPGPDFPSGATIINQDAMLDMYKTGVGKIIVRATLEYDKEEHALHVKEIPYLFAGSMDNLVAELAHATTESVNAQKKKVPPKIKGVNAVNNYSGKDGIDICLELQRGIDPEEMAKELFAKTRLETSVKFIFNALNDRQLSQYSLKQYLAEYTEFQHEITINEHKLEQESLQQRLEVIMGRILASMYVDAIVDVAKHANGRAQFNDVLVNGTILPGTDPAFHETVASFRFTQEQAEAVSGMMLYQLSRLGVDDLKAEGGKLQERLHEVEAVISDYGTRHALIIQRLEEELAKFPELPRKTRIINDMPSKASEGETPTVPFYVGIDRYGYVRVEGKPFEGASMTDNKSRIGFFDSTGTCWNIFMDRTKETKDRGVLVSRLIEAEGPIAGMATGIGKENAQGLFLFANGAMRRVEMSRYMTKTRATKINTRTGDLPLEAYYDIPENANIVTVDGVEIPLESIPLQALSGTGKVMLEPKDGPYDVTFCHGEVKAAPQKLKPGSVFDGVAMFTPDGQLLFDWTTLDTEGRDGLYVTTYQELIKQRLLFVHSDGTAKFVEGSQFAVKTKRSQVMADKDGMEPIYISPDPGETLVGHYEGGKVKRIDCTKIATQGKSGGGVRVFYTDKYQLERVESGDGSDLPVVSFATLPK